MDTVMPPVPTGSAPVGVPTEKASAENDQGKLKTEESQNPSEDAFAGFLLGLQLPQQDSNPKQIDVNGLLSGESSNENPSESFSSSTELKSIENSMEAAGESDEILLDKLQQDKLNGMSSLEELSDATDAEQSIESMRFSSMDSDDSGGDGPEWNAMKSLPLASAKFAEGLTPKSLETNPMAFSTLNLTPTDISSIESAPANTEPRFAEALQLPEIFRGVQQLSQQGGGRMTVALNPAELGEMQLDVSTNGRRVQVELIAESESVKSLVEKGLSNLQESLKEQNLQLTRMDVQVKQDGFEFQADSQGRESFDRSSSTFVDRAKPDSAALRLDQVTNSSLNLREGSGTLDGRVDIHA